MEVASHSGAAAVPAGCARLIDSNGEGESFWDVSKPLLRESLKEIFPKAKGFSLRVSSDPIRSQHIPVHGASLAAGETYTVRVPEKAKEEAQLASPPEKEEKEEAKCGICLETVVEQGAMDSCQHEFCFTCILKWSKVTNQCPMCKAEFSKIERKGSTPTAEQEPGRRRSRRLRKEPPAVVQVQPKKQTYEYTRQELEQIAGLHDEDEDDGPAPHHPYSVNPFFFPMGMGMGIGGMGLSPLQQFFLQSAFPHHLVSLAPPPPPPSRGARRPVVEDDDDDAWFEEDDSEDDITSFSVEEERPVQLQPTRGTASRATFFTPSATGSRARLRQLLAMPPEMRTIHRQTVRAASQPPGYLPPRGQPSFQSNLATLKSMFTPTFDEELLQTVLEQTGNNLTRATEALLEMQPPDAPRPENAESEETNLFPVNNKSGDVNGTKDAAIVVADDAEDLFLLGENPTQSSSNKRKFDWDTKSTTQQRTSNETSQTGNNSKRRRLRLSFGEMWEEEEKTGQARPSLNDRQRDEENEEEGESEELMELAWKDYEALQKEKLKDSKNAEGVVPPVGLRQNGMTQPRRAAPHLPPPSNNVSVPLMSPPGITLGEPQNPFNGHTPSMGGRQPPLTWHRTLSGNLPLPPHLRNSGGSLNRGK